MEQAGVADVWIDDAVELIEVLHIEGHGDFNRAVAAEIEEDDGVMVDNLTDRLAVFGDDEGWEVLVDDAELVTVGFDGFLRGGELFAFAEDVGVPTFLDHAPVGLVTVHGDLHTSAARSDLDVEVGIAELNHELLEFVDVDKRGGGWDVTAVQ